tara:strand:- start:379 stop:618 length:240 start_codon:yes stop_codon:yes gene_type:complete
LKDSSWFFKSQNRKLDLIGVIAGLVLAGTAVVFFAVRRRCVLRSPEEVARVRDIAFGEAVRDALHFLPLEVVMRILYWT